MLSLGVLLRRYFCCYSYNAVVAAAVDVEVALAAVIVAVAVAVGCAFADQIAAANTVADIAAANVLLSSSLMLRLLRLMGFVAFVAFCFWCSTG